MKDTQKKIALIGSTLLATAIAGYGCNMPSEVAEEGAVVSEAAPADSTGESAEVELSFANAASEGSLRLADTLDPG